MKTSTCETNKQMHEIFSKLADSKNLTQQEAQTAASKIFTALSKNEPNNIALLTTFFGALTIKKPSVNELIGTAIAMEKTKTTNFNFNVDKPVVTAGGTGGDTLHTINITTPAIITAAAAGAYAVKSGSKSFSSKTGCIDLAEALEINVHLSPKETEKCVEKNGTTIWASEGIYPWMHPLIEAGSKPPINQMMPLLYSLRLVIATALNPFSLKRQVRGVSEPFTELIAEVLGKCGYEKAFVVLGYGKTEQTRIDEFSTLGKNVVSELKTNGKIETYEVYPEEIGIKRGKAKEIVARESHFENAKVITRVLTGKDASSCKDIILLNAASILSLSDVCKELRDGYELAVQTIDEGRAIEKLKQLVQLTGGNMEKLDRLL
ncbi:MAG: anthranilate phosphoribosyltransferase [Candidatus Bathyarchaeia archaeon]|jgi:anthranilate phosphoribosyltransferase